jgi:hypothetical protein
MQMEPLAVEELLARAGLTSAGSASWGEPVREQGSGVYVITCSGREQPIVYIGRTRRAIGRRLREFYRHLQGDRRPHRGGDDILLLPGQLSVVRALAEDCAAAKARLIAGFTAVVGRAP